MKQTIKTDSEIYVEIVQLSNELFNLVKKSELKMFKYGLEHFRKLILINYKHVHDERELLKGFALKSSKATFGITLNIFQISVEIQRDAKQIREIQAKREVLQN